MRSRLYSYILRIDDGAAPNPFRGLCTLAICKPKIRSVAKKGDWVVGVGSKNAPSGDLSGRLVYAMKVQQALPWFEYDRRAPTDWPHRIPDINSKDLSTRLGDCIYDLSAKKARQRPGVHGPANMKTDLGGKKVLLSNDFYYFGSRAVRLPDALQPICPTTQGHRSSKNDPYVAPFESWLRGLGLTPGQLYGWPDFVVDWSVIASCGGGIPRANDEESDA